MSQALDSFAVLHPSFDEALGLLTLDLDHGKANEMGSEQLDAFQAVVEHVGSNDSIRCVCTTSRRTSRKGTPLFIAGANVTERTGWDDAAVKAHVIRQRELMRQLSRVPVFTTALVNGVTLGWGVEYLLACDYVIAVPEASFALPETGLGILPGARGTAELALRIGPAQALRLGCAGERIHAPEAARIGLVHEQVENLEVGAERIHSLSKQLARRSPTAVAAFKFALLDGLGRPEAKRLELEERAYERCVETGEAAIGRGAFAEIRAGETPKWGPRHT